MIQEASLWLLWSNVFDANVTHLLELGLLIHAIVPVFLAAVAAQAAAAAGAAAAAALLLSFFTLSNPWLIRARQFVIKVIFFLP